MRVTLVRHGETTGNSSVRYYGATDVPLSELGRVQMRSVREALADERFDAVFSSRLSRSREAAAIIAGEDHLVEPVAAFDEVDFGRWEGWTREEIAERDPDGFREWQEAGESFLYPEGESRERFTARVAAGLDRLVAGAAGTNLLLVVHRGVISVALARFLGLDAQQRAGLGIELGSIHAIERSAGAWRAAYLNRIDHLAQAGALDEESGSRR